MKFRYNIGLLAIGLMLLSSCSSTRYVQDGQFWLKKSHVKFDNHEETDGEIKREKHLSRSDFVGLQKQMPNARLFGYPLKLKLYSSVNIKKTHWWSRVMQRSGQAPVVFDTAYANQSVQQMLRYLNNKGYFEPSVHYVCDTLGEKKIGITYFITTGTGYRYRKVDLEVKDDSLVDLLQRWHSVTPLKPGEPYDVEVLRNEQLRITRVLQNRGYYFFNKDDIEFEIDSNLNAHLMDIKMIVKAPKHVPHNRVYTYGDVYIYPDDPNTITQEKTYDTTLYTIPKSQTDSVPQNYYFVHSEPLRIKPNIIASKLQMRPEETYSLTSVDRTYENLLDMRVYRSINLSVRPQIVDSGVFDPILRTNIDLRQAPVWSTESNFDLTSTENLQGAAVYTMLQNRNLFGGAEIFTLRLRGLAEVQYLLNKELRKENNLNLINNIDLKLDAGLDFPRFVAPFKRRTNSLYRPRTLINAGFSYQFRPGYYNRHILNTSFAYSWRQGRISHTLYPIDINTVKIDLSPGFQARIDTSNNMRLKYQYANHFIFGARYAFNYSGQQLNRTVSFNAFRFTVETSGHALSLLSHLLKASKNDDDQYQFFGLSYAQYIRFDTELKRHWYLNDEHILVARLMAGAGFAEGNSSILPYEKGFFAGGNNNIRAWPMDRIGPGSYNPVDNFNERIGDIVGVANVEYRFPILGAFKGAMFVDMGNIWLYKDNASYPNGVFRWEEIPKDLAVGGGIGLRWDLDFFVIRLDAALPLRDPAKSDGKKWVLNKAQFRDFVLNFGVGYPF